MRADPRCPACGEKVGARARWCMHCSAEFDAPVDAAVDRRSGGPPDRPSGAAPGAGGRVESGGAAAPGSADGSGAAEPTGSGASRSGTATGRDRRPTGDATDATGAAIRGAGTVSRGGEPARGTLAAALRYFADQESHRALIVGVVVAAGFGAALFGGVGMAGVGYSVIGALVLGVVLEWRGDPEATLVWGGYGTAALIVLVRLLAGLERPAVGPIDAGSLVAAGVVAWATHRLQQRLAAAYADAD